MNDKDLMAEKTESTAVSKPDDNIFSGLPCEALINQLTPAKNRVILLYITGQYNQRRIAEIVGIDPVTLRKWLGDPIVQEVIKELQKREFEIIDSSLKALRMKAVDTLNSLLDSPLDAVRYQATKDILDRTGHKPDNNVNVNKTVVNLEAELKSLARNSISDEDVIDITDVIEEIKNDYEEKYDD